MTTYIVNNVTGSDGNSGQNTGAAFKTIQKAANVASPGDIVQVMNAGQTYYESPLLSRSGNASNYITFKNYPGHNPTVDGKATGAGGGLPTAGKFTLFNPSEAAWSGGKTGVARGKGGGGLIKITGNYVIWDGINVKGSLARGLIVYNGAHHVIVRNCTIGPNYAHNIGLLGATHCTIDNCDIKEAGSYYPKARGTTPSTDGTAAVVFGAAFDSVLKNCRIYNNWGESTICDANWGASARNTIEDCVYWDNMKGCYIHGSSNITVQRCFFFRTRTERTQKKYNGDGVRGLSAGSVENTKYPDRDKGGKNLTFINNIFAGCGVAMLIKGSVNRDAMSNCLIANNTAVECNVAWALTVSVKNNMVFKNNIEFNNGTAVQGTGGSELGDGWTVDYNHWQSAVHANATGANDVIGNPGLVNPGYTITGSGGSAAYDATRYRLTAGSSARNAAQHLDASFTTDYNGATRTAWDMGAHEYDGNTAPTAAITASTTGGNAPLSVNFQGDPNSMTAYLWDFGDGTTSTLQDVTHIYNDPGIYTVRLTVTDSNGLSSTDTETITTLATESGSAPLVVEQVVFNEGASTYTVTATTAPKAALYFYSNAVSDATATANSYIGFGIAAGNGLATQYACGNYGDHGASPTNTARQMVSDKAIVFQNHNGEVVSGANITGATATTVSMTWTGTSASRKITGINFTGNGITNQSIQLVEPQAENGTYTINGDWNLAIMPFTGSEIDGNTGAQSFSFGFAKRGGNQTCVAYHNRDNQSAGDVRSATFDDRIAHTFRHGYGLQISSWSSGGITFKTIEDDGNSMQAPVLLMHVDSDFGVFVEDSPTATGNNDYTSNYGYNLQIALGLITNHAIANVPYLDDNAGVFGIFSTNSTPVDRTYLITSKDGAAQSDEQSYTDAQWVQLDEDTAVIGVGAATLITNGFRINPTTAHPTAYKMPMLAIKASTGGTGTVASFSHDADQFTTTETTINFFDTSAGGPASWAWDFGDDSGTSSDQNPTYQYTTPGTFTVTLEIDGGGDLKTTSKEVMVKTPHINIQYTITPTSGDAPLTLELDATASTTIASRNIDHSRTRWTFMRDFEDLTQAHGSETELVLLNPGSYDLLLNMYHELVEDDSSADASEPLFDLDVVLVSGTHILDFANVHDSITVAGPYTATFTPTFDHPLASSSTFDWDFGDTNTDQTTGPEAVENIYATVGTRTAYDVTLVVTTPDGVEHTVTKGEYITLVPTPERPLTLQEMLARIETIEGLMDKVLEHLGIITGTWVQNGTYSNVYQILLERKWAQGLTVTVYEDFTPMVSRASVGQVANEDIDGSYFTTFSAGNILTIYINPTGLTDPNTNGRDYRYTLGGGK